MPDQVAHPTQARLLASAKTALGQRQPAVAQRTLLEALSIQPNWGDALYLYGIASIMCGDAAKAADALRKLVLQRPHDANSHMYLGCALQDAGTPAEALLHLRRACELEPGFAAAWYNLGKALKQQDQLDDASRALRQALALDPRHLLARISLADICTMQGRITEAVAEYREVLRQQPGQSQAWHALANLKTEKLGADDAARIRAALQQPGIAEDARIELGFSLFKALEDQHDYAGAFAALHQANARKHRLAPWNAAAEHARIDAIIEAFRAALPVPPDPTLGQKAIFVVSLPRSGSTLVEHILASHPQVAGANEIPDLPDVIADESRRRGQPFPAWVAAATAQDWQRLGKDYLARTARWRERRPRFTDKNINNWPLLGAVRLMLPGAKIVHCHRDPLETCFSCYRQLFRHGVEYSYDLDAMADYYRDYEHLSAFWSARHPDRMLDFPYEALLREPETQIRRLLTFCELPFDPACLTPHRTRRDVLSTASAAQVREPIHGDTTHSAPYREQLRSLRGRLAR